MSVLFDLYLDLDLIYVFLQQILDFLYLRYILEGIKKECWVSADRFGFGIIRFIYSYEDFIHSGCFDFFFGNTDPGSHQNLGWIMTEIKKI